MIKINLKELLYEYNLNISDVSDATGISRSTLTPLVNDSESVKGIQFDTIDTLCDYFGVPIEELITFTTNKNNYFFVDQWRTDRLDSYTFLLEKKIGSKSRYSLLEVELAGMSVEDDGNIFLNFFANFYDNKQTLDFLKEVGQSEKMSSVPKKNIFENDISKQATQNIIYITKLLFRKIEESVLNRPGMDNFKEQNKFFRIKWPLKDKNISKDLYLVYDVKTCEFYKEDGLKRRIIEPFYDR